MRVAGHPVHVMLVHFPVACWPAHLLLHAFANQFPAEVSAMAGFWLLTGGTALGWLAALAGASDVLRLGRSNEPSLLRPALIHASINGSALLAFTVLAAWEHTHYPQIQHGLPLLGWEGVVLVAVAVGNFFGGAVVWRSSARGSGQS